MEKPQNKKLIDVYNVSVERYYQRTLKTWKVIRVKFDTNQGIVFYKPYNEKKEFREVAGKKVCFVNKEMIDAHALHSIILQISHTAIEQGMCKIKAHYKVWKREKNNYQYMLEDDIEGIEIVKLEEKVR